MLMQGGGRAARVHYLAGTFRLLSDGDHVVCAVTGTPIPLHELKYWSVERQEALCRRRRQPEGGAFGARRLADAASAHADLAVDPQEITAQRSTQDRDLLPRPRRIERDIAVGRLPHRIVVGDDYPVIAIVQRTH